MDETFPDKQLLVSAGKKEVDTECASGGIWKCKYCSLEEYYDYKGMKPPFAKHLKMLEDCYIIKDPFSISNKCEVLVLGANCSICKCSCCMECSIYYYKRFCKSCAIKNSHCFPSKLNDKIKQLNNK
ncbi:unnamed protein product [Trichogramma brassicae]|uniref:Cysteine-rich DPF motif domain-containing protein 1 n=1 Tax=Trichogramma brassicae TaxID=86971 RepID=A0A6H5J0T7_9HYME|nr:unnamed protein product [Trichogramma brassicae]